MARLIVEAASEDTIAGPGNQQANYVVLSVTKTSGVPVTGLTTKNIDVEALIVGPGGALVDISSVSGAGFPGFYFVDIVPIKGQTWKSGTYIFAVVVKNGSDKGQTLTSVLMD
jgi:hypothetical protein